MPNILIWMSPEPGHVLPTIKIAKDLQGDGNTVWYQVPPGQQHELEMLGVRTVAFFDHVQRQVPTYLFEPSRSAHWEYLSIATRYPERSYREAFQKEIADAVRFTDAKLLIVDGVFDDLIDLTSDLDLPHGCECIRIYIHLPYKSVLARDAASRRWPSVFLCPKEFEIPELLRSDAYYTEGSIFEGVNHPFPWHSVDRARPMVYCSFGSQIERYPTAEENLKVIIAAAANWREFQFVINAGRLATKLQILSTPDTLIVPRAPQVSILKLASAMISHGGFGSVKDCVRSETPMLLIPQRWDQFLNARRVLHHRLGLSLDNNSPTVESIRASIVSILANGEIRRSLSAMAEIFETAERNNPTLALVRDFLSRRRVRS